jgi:hypothetical protein
MAEVRGTSSGDSINNSEQAGRLSILSQELTLNLDGVLSNSAFAPSTTGTSLFLCGVFSRNFRSHHESQVGICYKES